MHGTRPTPRPPVWPTTAVWVGIALLITIVVVFAVLRVTKDLPFLLSGEVPREHSFEHPYVTAPVPAYLHIVPGLVYLIGGCFQLSRRFRNRHPTLHRRMGRVILGAGLISGFFALAFGTRAPYGGIGEAAATIVFGSYFLVALALALRAILRRDVRTHRRWMIRAFALGLAVATIRLWVGVFVGLGVDLRAGFAPAFWLAFTMHAAAAELWLAFTGPNGGLSPARRRERADRGTRTPR